MVKFGCYIYQDGLDYGTIRNVAVECEKLGFDSIWIKDNFIPWLHEYLGGSTAEREAPLLEAWTTLAALASDTASIRLGTILCNSYRQPSLVAKMGATLDVISNGRLDLGLSAGWYRREYESYGIPFRSPRNRVEMLEEAAKIIKKLWSENETSFYGKHYSIKDAICNPKPIQKPNPPLWIGGAGKKRTLKLVAELADGWNYSLCTLDQYKAALEVLESWCQLVGKNYDKITKAWQPMILIGNNADQVSRKTKELLSLFPSLKEVIVAGTSQQVLKQIEKYVELGVSYISANFPFIFDLTSLRLFAHDVMPSFRNS